jgi:hypothetical protein
MMTVDRCDFQIPPAVPGWYGIVSGDAAAGNILHQAAFWNGGDWEKYPVRAYARSTAAFATGEAALEWAISQLD